MSADSITALCMLEAQKLHAQSLSGALDAISMTPNMSKKRGFTVAREISVGTLMHIMVLILSTAWFAGRITLKQEEILDQLKQDHARIERIETYLAARDPHYWQTVRAFHLEEQ